jgi:HK97 gp10 family phage protein
MMEFGANLGKDLHYRTLAMADELIENMRDAAPKDTGTLANSIRKKDVTRGGNGPGQFQEVSVLVIGGGAPTLRRTHTGNTYDYSLANEFGTRKEQPHPFFYATYRKYRNFGNELFAETVQDAVEENNKLRDLRSDGSQAMITHRGAVLNTKGIK